MAVRQMLMWYFKRVDFNGMETNVILDNSQFDLNFRHNYQRDRFRIDVPCHMYIGRSAVAELHKSPASLTFYMKTWDRSPEMTAVYKGVRQAVDDFLLGVKVDVADKGRASVHEGGDELLLRQNRLEQKRYSEPVTSGEYDRLREITGSTLSDRELQQIYGRIHHTVHPVQWDVQGGTEYIVTTSTIESNPYSINFTDVPF
jgi:hypothetical protein